MRPENSYTSGGHTVEEYYWAGEYVVYLDSRLVSGSFDRVVAELEERIANKEIENELS